MSKKVPEEQYQKTFSYKFKQWLDGTKDPFLDTVEMKRQETFLENKEVLQQREEEKEQLLQKACDLERNAEFRIFRKSPLPTFPQVPATTSHAAWGSPQIRRKQSAIFCIPGISGK